MPMKQCFIMFRKSMQILSKPIWFEFAVPCGRPWHSGILHQPKQKCKIENEKQKKYRSLTKNKQQVFLVE